MKILLAIAAAILLTGCGENEYVGLVSDSVLNGTVIELEASQGVGIRYNSKVSIINLENNKYYISCNYEYCNIVIFEDHRY